MTRNLVSAGLFFLVLGASCRAQEGGIEYNLVDMTDGSNISVEAGSPSLVLLEFWASWCSPCMSSLVRTDSLASQHAGKLKVVLVNSFDGPEKIRTIISEKGVRLFSARDEQSVLYKQLGSPLLPHAVLHNGDGAILWQGNPYYLTHSALSAFIAGDPHPEAKLRQDTFGYEFILEAAKERTTSSIEVQQRDGRFRYVVRNKAVPTILRNMASFCYSIAQEDVKDVRPPFGPFVDLTVTAAVREDRKKVMESALHTLLHLYGATLRAQEDGNRISIEYK